jgi:hypothetical protein
LRFRQEYKWLPVWPYELIVHLDKDGGVDLMDGASFTPREVGHRSRPCPPNKHFSELEQKSPGLAVWQYNRT